LQNRHLVALFCEGVDGNPYLSPMGRFLLKRIAIEQLKKRKKVLQYYYTNKEFIDTHGQLKAPVIVTGLPRSGTTLLQRLLSEDPNTRSPYTYELETPTPPLAAGANPLRDHRINRSGPKILSRLAPGLVEKLAESHLWSATEMEESFLYMLYHNGMPQMNSASAGSVYVEHFYNIADKRPIFRYERLFFTILDAYRPARSHWTFKSPVYAPFFPLIFEEYPDAKVVVTHRNPLVVLPSACRLLESWCIAFDQDGSFDKHRFGQFQKMAMKKFLRVPLNYRKAHPEKEEQIIDCLYDDLLSDPIAMVRRIYEKFGLEYTREFERRMKAYLADNQQGKHGRHRYSLEEYGFNEKGVYRDHQDYLVRYGFGIPEKNLKPA